MPRQFRIVVVTDRPAVGSFYAGIGLASSDRVSATIVDPGPRTSARVARAVAVASVALVDSSGDPAAARAVCGDLRVRRPELPIAILFCCPCSATPSELRSFVSVGIASFLDLQLSPERALNALRAVGRGEDVMCLQLASEAVTTLFNSDDDDHLDDEELVLLRLVAAGMTDHEIGAEMFVSHHTVKHRIERLRHRANARNRIQLAAWAAGRLELSGGQWPPQSR